MQPPEEKKKTPYQQLMIKIASVLPSKFAPIFLHPAGWNQFLWTKSIKFVIIINIFINTGPTTVFFWAPTFKWGLVIAGIGDLRRPPETISLSQTASLMITGAIWSRYLLNNIIFFQRYICIYVYFK